jgi:hypothetical protein
MGSHLGLPNVGDPSAECLAPAEHLDDGIDFVQRRRDLGRRRVAKVSIDG